MTDTVWHHLAPGPGPAVGTAVHGAVDRTRRHRLMRTHSALHVLCGVVWNRWGAFATGNIMEPLAARIDDEFDPLPDAFACTLEAAIAAEIAADPELIRTKTNLNPVGVAEVRVVKTESKGRGNKRIRIVVEDATAADAGADA